VLSFKQSPEEEFWKIKMTRYIDECSSVTELKQIATLLATICSTRQTVIKALVKENLDQMTENLGKALEG
jgi:phage terminase Nu1 subunit (DNA packaging protein)|tara:strand:+ start:282 stop:491 length:210 start_codon:yes stop_codon:yes gene_type:complete